MQGIEGCRIMRPMTVNPCLFLYLSTCAIHAITHWNRHENDRAVFCSIVHAWQHNPLLQQIMPVYKCEGGPNCQEGGIIFRPGSCTRVHEYVHAHCI